MTERNDNHVHEHDDEAQSTHRSSEIRFLKEERRGGSRPLFWALILLAVAVAYALMARRALLSPPVPAAPAADTQSAAQLVDRIWVDKVPERDSESFSFYIFSSEENLGIHDQAASVYRHALEIFFYHAASRELTFKFPHDRRTGKTAYTIEKLSKPDKYQIDMKLTIASDPQADGKEHIYYSSTKWSSLDQTGWPETLRGIPTRVPHIGGGDVK